jgi:hypothetical protein
MLSHVCRCIGSWTFKFRTNDSLNRKNIFQNLHIYYTPIALTTQKRNKHFLLAFSLQASTIQLCVHKCP